MRRLIVIANFAVLMLAGCDEPAVEESPANATVASDGATSPLAPDASTDAAPITPASPVDATVDAGDDTRLDAASGSPGNASDASQGASTDANVGTGSLPNTGAPPASSNEIESIGFTLGTNSNPRPVLLFKDGYACWDASLAAQDPIDAAAHRAAHPADWHEWRRTPVGVEVKSGQAWKPLEYPYEYGPVASGTQLSGLYGDAYSPDPNASPLVALFWRYRFHPDGTFEYCKTSEIIGEYPIFSKERLMRAGTYSIGPYSIKLDGTDGKTERLSFFQDASQSKALFIGNNYFFPEGDNEATCF